MLFLLLDYPLHTEFFSFFLFCFFLIARIMEMSRKVSRINLRRASTRLRCDIFEILREIPPIYLPPSSYIISSSCSLVFCSMIKSSTVDWLINLTFVKFFLLLLCLSVRVVGFFFCSSFALPIVGVSVSLFFYNYSKKRVLYILWEFFVVFFERVHYNFFVRHIIVKKRVFCNAD